MKVTIHWRASRERTILKMAQYACAIFGVAALGFCVLAYFEARIFQAQKRSRFEAALTRKDPPQALRLFAQEGSPLGRIEIPRLALSVVVAEGITPRTLRLAAGHIPGTSFPDEAGNIGIAGHRDTFFRKLREIRQDDIIIVTTLVGANKYSVESIRVVKPADREVLGVSDRPMLTLVTCYPFKYTGPAPKRFIVQARLTGSQLGSSVCLTRPLYTPPPPRSCGGDWQRD